MLSWIQGHLETQNKWHKPLTSLAHARSSTVRLSSGIWCIQSVAVCLRHYHDYARGPLQTLPFTTTRQWRKRFGLRHDLCAQLLCTTNILYTCKFVLWTSHSLEYPFKDVDNVPTSTHECRPAGWPSRAVDDPAKRELEVYTTTTKFVFQSVTLRAEIPSNHFQSKLLWKTLS